MKTKSYSILKEFKNNTTAFLNQISTSVKSIKESYDDDILLVKEDLITKIASDYSLDLSELKRRYLRKKKKSVIGPDNENNILNNSDSEYIEDQIEQKISEESNLLYKIEYNSDYYYIELFDGGKVYDKNKNEVGIWKNDMRH